MDEVVISNEYRKSVTEVIYILKYLPEHTVSKIPIKFMDFLNEHSISDYKPNFDFSQGLDKVMLSNKTKALLAMIYRNYICTEEERAEYDKILCKNEEIYQNNLREKYNPDNIFKKEKQKITDDNSISNEMQIVEYKETIFIKFMNFMKRLLNWK